MKLEALARTLGVLLVTALIEALANFLVPLSIDTQLIILVIGIFSSIIIATLDHVVPSAIEATISRRLEIYRLISQIEDSEFRDLGHQVLADCQYKLEQLARGEFRTRMGARYDRERLRTVKTEVRAMSLGMLYQRLGRQPSWIAIQEERQWYEENLRALKRGIRIVRIFILQKAKTLDEVTGNVLDQELLEVMKQQQNDGIQVRVAWEHVLASNVGTEAFQDFAILDRFEVIASDHYPDGSYEGVIWRNSTKVQYFERIFAAVFDYSEPLDDLLSALHSR